MSERDNFFEAIKSDNLEAVQAMLQANPALAEAKSAQGVSAILFARYHRRDKILEALKESKPSLDLFEAAALGDTAEIGRLAENFGADPNSVSGDGFTPLQLACFFGHYDAARLLLNLGADVKTPSLNPMRLTALHSAAAGRSTRIVEALLTAGADPNARQNGGWTALHSAAGQGSAALADLLLRHGADPKLASDDGLTPAKVAEEKGHHQVFHILTR
jgi:ankyrin repeat protein